MKKFFIKNIKETNCQVEDWEIAHLTRVLRMQKGDRFLGLACDEFEYECEIVNMSKNSVDARILQKSLSGKNPKQLLTVFQGVLKGEKNELVIQKLSELGASSLVFFQSENTVSNLKKESKIERLKKIALESCKQCGRSMPLEINHVVSLGQIDFSLFDLVLFLYENAPSENTLFNLLDKIISAKKVAIIIGAEGGFSEKENSTQTMLRII